MLGRVIFPEHGAVAQLAERLHGMQEVRGSIPLSSTIMLRSADNRKVVAGKTKGSCVIVIDGRTSKTKTIVTVYLQVRLADG